MSLYYFYSSMFLILITDRIIVAVGEENPLRWDRISLMSFKASIVFDPENSLSSWSSTKGGVHAVCNWYGVKCNNESTRVIQLDVSGCSLHGKIPPSIANISDLSVLDLSRNFFNGHIPPEIGSLQSLKQLSLSENLLEGNIPSSFGSLHHLVYLDLRSNGLKGEIPPSLFCNGSSSSLQYIDLSNNSLTGEIPMKNDCDLKELRFLLAWSNKLVGNIPLSLSNSYNLQWLDFESNLLTGELPSSVITGKPQLQFLYLSDNFFISHDNNTNLEPFFASLANSSNLQELELAGNSLGGELTSITRHLPRSLVQIHLDQNRIHGSIPPEISNLSNLTLLNLSSNLLSGQIPRELCELRRLEQLYLSDNLLTGEIPAAVGDIPRLGLLDLSRNKLSGPIPNHFTNLLQLRSLLLFANQLSGTIPRSLGNCMNLEILDLSHNKLSGEIPAEVVSKLSNLKLFLNFSGNSLSGSIPLELSKMDMVLAIDLSSNNFSGKLPPQLGSCIALEHLNVSRNSFEGSLPSSIGNLPYLTELDVSFNRLTGEIPSSFQESSSLKHMNFSFNMFSGHVSNSGAFAELTSDSFLGDISLCSSIKGMMSCKKKHIHRYVLIPILLSLFLTPFCCAFGYPLVRRSRFHKNRGVSNEDDEEERQSRKDPKYPRISYRKLIEATGGFSSSSLIGSGRFGHVYKGTLRNSTMIAVKVLHPETSVDVSRSFKTECQILRRIRHRNVMRIITICSRPDFKALVLPLMINGSLEQHLYPSNREFRRNLDLIQLVNICGDVAEGLAYLHHHSPVKVVHCDLKPSNILLDEDMKALVTDFGISRLVKGIEETVSSSDSVSFPSTDGLLCGSFGYIPPEYGMGKRASIHGDVYSFGVVLLEIVMGKRPTDVLNNEGLSLHDFVKSRYPHKLGGIVEETLLRWKPLGKSNSCEKLWREITLELIELGLICTQCDPSTRPNMIDVAHEMGRLKEYLFTRPPLLDSAEEEEEEASSSKSVVSDNLG